MHEMVPTYKARSPRAHAGLILLFAAAGLLIFGPTYSTVLPSRLRLGGLAAVILISFVITWVFNKIARLWSYWRLAFAYFVASCALMLSSYAGDWALIISNQTIETVEGFTFLKLAEDAAIIGTIILLTLITRDKPEELYLCKGSLGLGLVIGLITFLVFTVLGYSSTMARGIQSSRVRELLPVFGLIALADGFMEELLFRGLFLRRLGRFVGDNWANVVTATVFTFVHLGVQFTASLTMFLIVIFLLGLLWGWIMQRTGSVLASALFHAGIDMLIIADAFTIFGVEI